MPSAAERVYGDAVKVGWEGGVVPNSAFEVAGAAEPREKVYYVTPLIGL